MPKFVALSKPSLVSNDDIVPAAKPSLVSAAEAPFTGLASGLIWIIFSPIAGVSENGEPPKLKLTVELSLETVPSVSQPVKSDEKSSKMVCANPDGAGSFLVVMNALPHLRFIKMSTRCPKTKLTETPSAPQGSN